MGNVQQLLEHTTMLVTTHWTKLFEYFDQCGCRVLGEQNLANVTRHWISKWHSMGIGNCVVNCVGCMFLLHLERCQVYRQGCLRHSYLSVLRDLRLVYSRRYARGRLRRSQVLSKSWLQSSFWLASLDGRGNTNLFLLCNRFGMYDSPWKLQQVSQQFLQVSHFMNIFFMKTFLTLPSFLAKTTLLFVCYEFWNIVLCWLRNLLCARLHGPHATQNCRCSCCFGSWFSFHRLSTSCGAYAVVILVGNHVFLHDLVAWTWLTVCRCRRFHHRHGRPLSAVFA